MDDQASREAGPDPTLACPACGDSVLAADCFCEACGNDLRVPPEPAVGDPAGSGHAGTVSAGSGHAGAAADGVTADGAAAYGVTVGGLSDAPASPCLDCGATAVSAEGYCEQCGQRRPDARDHFEIALAADVCGVSDKGLRHHHNEDAMALAVVEQGTAGAATVVAVVCDGVSSSPRPEQASQAAADTGVAVLTGELSSGNDLEAAMLAAGKRAAAVVADLAVTGGPAPACTFVSAAVTADTVTVGWVGDSRVYWLGSGQPGAHPSKTLTRDDSWAAQMVAFGVMSEEEAASSRRAHMLTGWFGGDAGEVDVHVDTFRPGGPGAVLVCSDGLWNYLPGAEELAIAVPSAAEAPLAAAQALVQIALDAGGRDNITVAVIPFPPTQRAFAEDGASPYGPVAPEPPPPEPAGSTGNA